MTNNNVTILIVDDDAHILEFLAAYIEGAGYQVVKAENGQAGLAMLEQHQQQLGAVVSDVDMPVMNGYEFCQALRADDRFRDIPFIFASALNTLEEKLRGYDSGGDDYITKPLQGEEVVTKVDHIIQKKIRHETMASDLAASRSAAMQAMTYTSNLGLVLQFTRDAMLLNDYAALAKTIFSVLDNLGVAPVIQFYAEAGQQCYKPNGEVAPLEANVLELARGKERIFDFKNRTIYNYEDFSLLIKNMPVDDPERYGMLKDVLSNLCDAIEIKTRLLLTTGKVQRKDGAIHEVDSTLAKIEQSYSDIQQINTRALEDLVNRMEDAMIGFGLSEAQEDTVRGIISYARRKTAEAFEDGKELFDEFEKIRSVLREGMK